MTTPATIRPDLRLAPQATSSGVTWAQWYDAQAPHWDEHLQRIRWYREQVVRTIQYAVPKGSRVLEIGCATGQLLAALEPSHGVGVDSSAPMIERARRSFSTATHPHLEFHHAAVEQFDTHQPFDAIVLDGLAGSLHDVEYVLHRIAGWCGPRTRLIVSYHNALFEPLFGAAESFGLRLRMPVQNWISNRQMANLLRLAGYNLIRVDHRHFCPVPVPFLGGFLENIAGRMPGFRHLNLMSYAIARFAGERRADRPSVSVICPCRNEAGNISAAVERLPMMGSGTELIFVEGNSTDDTLAQCREIAASTPNRDITVLQQGDGKGKGDAVRKGFAAAKGDILMILDADLTVPPEELPKFYWAIASGKGEMINGTRMVYPMESQAMRFLNKLGNKAFSAIFTWILGQPLSDTLCGTKVMWREDYERLAANRSYFGEFDPFGDFDLLFGSAKLGLEMIEVPVRYRDRTYGSTNIQRFRHGWLLLKMSVVAARKIRFRP